MKLDREKLNSEQLEMLKTLEVMIMSSRWIYELSLERKFTPAQSLELAKTYMIGMLTASFNGGQKK